MSTTAENTTKIVNLMQFARKAGKLISGAEACLRAMTGRGLHLIIIAADTAPRTISRITNATVEKSSRIPVIQISTQVEMSTALGLPVTAIFGIRDKQFAAKMLEYSAATANVEE